MRLQLLHPVLARVSCSECQVYLIDYDWKTGKGTGKRMTYAGGTKDWERHFGTKFYEPPPCEKCPKQSPAQEHEHILSDKNWKTWQFYREVRATNGACLTDEMRQDRLLMQNLSIIDGITRSYERGRLANEFALAMAGFI